MTPTDDHTDSNRKEIFFKKDLPSVLANLEAAEQSEPNGLEAVIGKILGKLYPMEYCACDECGGGRSAAKQAILNLITTARSDWAKEVMGKLETMKPKDGFSRFAYPRDDGFREAIDEVKAILNEYLGERR